MATRPIAAVSAAGERRLIAASPPRGTENSSNASPGPAAKPMGKDCAQGGGDRLPDRFGHLGAGPARLEPGGDRLPVVRTAGQFEPAQAGAGVHRRPSVDPGRLAGAAAAARGLRLRRRGSWAACSRACRSLLKNVCRRVESRWL